MKLKSTDQDGSNKIRLDKWLWAARFFKTRSLAAQAVSNGKVQIEGARIKPARALALGETLTIRRGPYEYKIVVRKLSRKRGPAQEAALLYEETSESLEKRETLAAQLKLQAAATPHPPRKPNKKDRRRITQFTNRNS